MLARLDAFCVTGANRLASHLQEQMAMTMPIILRHLATATIMATVLAIISTALMRGVVITAITLVFGIITISSYWRLLARYSKDAEKDWNSDLARDYMVRAIGAMEGQRRIREIGLIFALICLGMSFSIAQLRVFDLVDMTMIFLVFSTMLHMYMSCAEPKPPGTRRREMKLALQGFN
ncbi:MAG: hypothetical protein NTZ14_12345 [Hyphomicrobiales bacterium]|nr:hypothetical protein [Hyphomicrobiales bacterium]